MGEIDKEKLLNWLEEQAVKSKEIFNFSAELVGKIKMGEFDK